MSVKKFSTRCPVSKVETVRNFLKAFDQHFSTIALGAFDLTDATGKRNSFATTLITKFTKSVTGHKELESQRYIAAGIIQRRLTHNNAAAAAWWC